MAGVRCLSLLTSVFETEVSLTELEHTISARLAGQRTPRIDLSLLPRTEVTDAPLLCLVFMFVLDVQTQVHVA